MTATENYLSEAQVAQLLRAINPVRVGKDGKGFSHVESYEIKAHLNRIFGFARWSWDVLDQQPIFEECQEKPGKNGTAYKAWTVGYRTIGRLTICAPDGTVLATYTEGHVGDASNQPSRADAHALALTTSESQSLKRAAICLGDNFGLSLYRRGSTDALVGKTLLRPGTTTADVEQHAPEHVPETSAAGGNPPVTPPVAAESGGGAASSLSSAPPPAHSGDPAFDLDKLRDDLLAATGSERIAVLLGKAAKAKVMSALVADANGEAISVQALADRQMKTFTKRGAA